MIQDVLDDSNTEMQSIQQQKSVFNVYQKQTITTQPPSSIVIAPSPVKECRICLEGHQEMGDELICPCKCSGSVKFVHQQCYRKWIECQMKQGNARQQQQLRHEGMKCQICKQTVKLNFICDYFCSGKATCAKIKTNLLAFIVCTTFLLAILVCILYLIYICANEPLDFRGNLVKSTIILSLLSILGISVLLIVYHCVSEYLIHVQWVLQGYRTKHPTKIASMDVIPSLSIIPVEID